MFGGHYNTVNNSPAADARPGDANEPDGTPHFRVDENGRSHGLGVLDMKGGIVIAIYVVKALAAAGRAERPIKLLPGASRTPAILPSPVSPASAPRG